MIRRPLNLKNAEQIRHWMEETVDGRTYVQEQNLIFAGLWGNIKFHFLMSKLLISDVYHGYSQGVEWVATGQIDSAERAKDEHRVPSSFSRGLSYAIRNCKQEGATREVKRYELYSRYNEIVIYCQQKYPVEFVPSGFYDPRSPAALRLHAELMEFPENPYDVW